jgi:hypothetical protein
MTKIILVVLAIGALCGTEQSSQGNALYMRYDGSWGRGLLQELSIKLDGQFINESKNLRMTGKIPLDDLKKLIDEVVNADDGPGAEDADSVTFQWIETDGNKQSKRVYTYPARDPCKTLLIHINEAVKKYGKEEKNKVFLFTAIGLTSH